MAQTMQIKQSGQIMQDIQNVQDTQNTQLEQDIHDMDGTHDTHYVIADFEALEEAENSEAGKEAISELENFIEETMTPALNKAEENKVQVNIIKARFHWIIWLGANGDDACYIPVEMFGYFEFLEFFSAILDEYGMNLFSENRRLFAR